MNFFLSEALLAHSRAEIMPMPTPSFRFPGVLNSQELLVAEAIVARAWGTLSFEQEVAVMDADAAKARLGVIVVRLMLDRSRSISDLSTAAVHAFLAVAKSGEREPDPRVPLRSFQIADPQC